MDIFEYLGRRIMLFREGSIRIPTLECESRSDRIAQLSRPQSSTMLYANGGDPDPTIEVEYNIRVR